MDAYACQHCLDPLWCEQHCECLLVDRHESPRYCQHGVEDGHECEQCGEPAEWTEQG